MIEQSAPELFALMFGSEAVARLTDLVQRSRNRFSHHYVRVAEIDHRVVGMVILVPAISVQDRADYRDGFTITQRIWLKLVHSLLPYVVRHDYPAGTFYIGNLAVAAEYRNQGIGHQLLSQCIAEVKAASSTLFISVDVSNLRAQKLYESLGFKVVGTKTIRLFGTTIGSHILALSILD
ncbi:MAG: GNAT family N-acetyltransferase [Leptolyngbyaceae cyanobacterium SL_7_1]|nr:GNAT family N-acetyltransferase [Leptolyngbyaceae cyanobacterium SL_7_1]